MLLYAYNDEEEKTYFKINFLLLRTSLIIVNVVFWRLCSSSWIRIRNSKREPDPGQIECVPMRIRIRNTTCKTVFL
jgi:hypothetical protein